MKLPKPLYEVKLIEQDDNHYYQIGDDPTFYPGSTGLLNYISKPALAPWSAKVSAQYYHRLVCKAMKAKRPPTPRFFETLCRRARKEPTFVKRKAGADGTKAHAEFDYIVRRVIEGKFYPIKPLPFHESFRYWLSKEKLKFVTGDTKVGSKLFGYGGSLDVLLWDEVSQRFVVGDFKTGKNIWDTMSGQVSSYSYAMKETYGLPYLPSGLVVRFHRDKKYFQRWVIRDVTKSFDFLLYGLGLHRTSSLSHWETKEIIKLNKQELKDEAKAASKN